MTSHQTQERRAIPPSVADAEGATRSPQDAPSALIREDTDFPGPHSPTVSGGIPGTPSSDALRAQKSVGTGMPVRGRDAEGVTHHRKSLRAANEFTDSLGCGGASASSTFFGCETVSKGQPAGISRPLDDRLENRTVQDRPAHSLEDMIAVWKSRHGEPRRFKTGEVTDFNAIKVYLEQWGYHVRHHGARCSVSNGRGRPKMLTRRQLLAFVDEFRTAEGLAPILAEAS